MSISHLLVRVSIHASGGEATFITPACCISVDLFQSTPPGGRRLTDAVFLLTANLFQSTPPGGRRPYPTQGWKLLDRVSIHASGGEATLALSARTVSSHVSIHASGGEATALNIFVKGINFSFNPRLRGGGDVFNKTID